MTREQAKEFLSTRPVGAPPGTDSEWTEALRLVASDRELQDWWEERQRFNSGVRTALRTIPVPSDLAERILAERPRSVVRLPAPDWRLWAAVAAVLLLGGWLIWWWLPPRSPQFSDFRNRMARAALRDYRMDVQTSDLAAIQRYLAQHRAPAGYALSRRLEALPGLGCGVLRWQNQPVSMVCFDLGQGQVLWLFIAEQAAVAGAPASREPAFVALGRLATAAWSAGNHVYLLMAVGTQDLLKSFL